MRNVNKDFNFYKLRESNALKSFNLSGTIEVENGNEVFQSSHVADFPILVFKMNGRMIQNFSKSMDFHPGGTVPSGSATILNLKEYMRYVCQEVEPLRRFVRFEAL